MSGRQLEESVAQRERERESISQTQSFEKFKLWLWKEWCQGGSLCLWITTEAESSEPMVSDVLGQQSCLPAMCGLLPSEAENCEPHPAGHLISSLLSFGREVYCWLSTERVEISKQGIGFPQSSPSSVDPSAVCFSHSLMHICCA